MQINKDTPIEIISGPFKGSFGRIVEPSKQLPGMFRCMIDKGTKSYPVTFGTSQFKVCDQ